MCVCDVCTDSCGHACECVRIQYVLIHVGMCVSVGEGVGVSIWRLEVNIEILLNRLLPYRCCFGDRVSH